MAGRRAARWSAPGPSASTAGPPQWFGAAAGRGRRGRPPPAAERIMVMTLPSFGSQGGSDHSDCAFADASCSIGRWGQPGLRLDALALRRIRNEVRDGGGSPDEPERAATFEAVAGIVECQR